MITSFTANSEGLTFLFKVEAITEDSGAKSPALSIKLAGSPADPTTAPKNSFESTNTTKITIILDEVANNGKDSIVSYNLQMDDGCGGDFINLSEFKLNSLHNLNMSYLKQSEKEHVIGLGIEQENLLVDLVVHHHRQ